MSRVPLEIPKVGLVMENARLVRWLKRVGEKVRQGEPLLELETEKSVVEIEATDSGSLVEILMDAGQEVRVGDRVGWLESDASRGAADASSPRQAPARPSAQAPAQVLAAAPAGPPARSIRIEPGNAGMPTAAASAAAGPRPSAGRIKSSPVARRMASEHSMDLSRITATGPRGRIQLSDVRRAIEARGLHGGGGAGAGGAVAAPQALSSMRRALARSMTLSNATVPQFFVERAVDWTTLQSARARLVAGLPTGTPRPSVNDFLLQAIARSLLAFPQLNAVFSGDASSPEAALVPAQGTHIGLVVAVENGILVPVLHEIERITIVELARRREATVQRALGGKLKRDELEGATFSLSNLGARGPDRFTALINPPQSAILAVGRQRDCVIARNGGIHIRPMSQLALTVDHRVADGRLAAEFLAYLVELLEGDDWRLT